jgi:hypothetical protein
LVPRKGYPQRAPRVWHSVHDAFIHSKEHVSSFAGKRRCRRSPGGSAGVGGLVTPGFKIKTRCSSYVCPGSSYHTYDQNVNTEKKCLYYITFITRILSLHRRLYRLSHQAAAEQSNSTGNQPWATQASRRNLHHRNPYHLQLLSSVTTRVSSLMVATQQVKEKHNNIYICAGSEQTKVLQHEASYT